MKIKSIKLINHPVLGNNYFDFCDSDKNPVDTIIIAGENGTGKTVLLNLIYEFSNHSFNNIQRNEKYFFEIMLTNPEIDILRTNKIFSGLDSAVFKDNCFNISFNFNVVDTFNQIEITSIDQNNNKHKLPPNLFSHEKHRRIIKSIFSDVEINFTSAEISTVGSSDIDRTNNNSVRSGSDLATQISQLLIDIYTLDALEFNEWAKNNVGGIIDDSRLDSRIKRFTNAFNYMFPQKRFKRISNENNRKNILFSEYGYEVPINKLSSGEKQIVFRGSFLLKDKKSNDGAIILIDEPEISMHPLWQLKILDFFKKLFTNEVGTQTSQMFIATHSPFIIHNSNRYNDKVIILEREAMGRIQIKNEPEFMKWTNKEIIEKAFNIDFKNDIDSQIVFVEGETDEKYLNKAIQLFKRTDISFKIKWIGRTLGNGKIEFSGDTALNQAKQFFQANQDYFKHKIILLYDNDTNKSEENLGNVLIRRIKFNNSNLLYKKGIENNLNLHTNFAKDDFYKENKNIDGYGAESIVKQLDKNKLCDWICNSLSENEQFIYMKNFNEILDKLKESFINC